MTTQFLRRNENPTEIAYLTGAGISVPNPSRLPTATDFITRIIDEVGENAEQKKTLLKRLFGNNKGQEFKGDFIRFESVMASIKSLIDQQLNILEIFSKCEYPNFYHFFLARQLAKGSMVLTANFDNLIETACRILRIEYKIIVTDDDFDRYMEKPNQYPHPIVKLHGGHNILLSDGSRKIGPINIKTTILQVGQQYPDIQNTELSKFMALVFQKYHICVLGYSGCDDFDIIPVFKFRKLAKGLTWIEHSEQDEIHIMTKNSPAVETNVDESKFVLPSRDLLRCKKNSEEEIVIVLGDTAKVLDIADKEFKEKDTIYYWDLTFNKWKDKFLGEKSNQQLLLADLLLKSNHYENAIVILERIEKKHFYDFQIQYYYLILASCYVYINQWEKAITKLTMLALSDNQNKDLKSKGSVYLNLARINTDMGNIDQSEMYLKRAMEIFKKEKDIARIADCCHEVGRVLLEKRNPDKAIEYYQISLKISEEFGDLHGASMSQGEIGRAYTQNQEYELALLFLNKAISTLLLLGDKYGLGIYYHALGNVYYYKEEYERSIDFFHKAIILERQTGSNWHLGHSLHCLGNSLLSQGKIQEAKRYFLDSLAIKRAIKDEVGIRNTEYSLGTINLLEQSLSGLEDLSIE